MTGKSLTFHWADYLVLGAFLVFTTLLGVVIGWRDRKKATSKEFLMGGGDMHYLPVAMSMFMSFMSAIYLLSTPMEIYTFGTMFSYAGISYILSTTISGFMFLPILHRLKVTSAYQYLELRFNRTVRLCGSATCAVTLIMYLPIVMYTPSIALAEVTGLTVEFSTGVVGVICIAYTVVGGMKATIWNDFCQTIVVFAGLICLIVFGSLEVGGLSRAWEISKNGSRVEFDDFDPNPTNRITFWTQIIGSTVLQAISYSSSQTDIQKFLSIKKLRNAQKAIMLAGLAQVILLIHVVLVGVLAYAYYATCDPVLSGRVQKRDQIIPLFVMEVMGHLPGLPGLFLSSAFSAALSSLSGSLNALSAITLVDFIKPIYFNTKGVALTERTSNIISRCLALVYGALVLGLGFLVPLLSSIVLQVATSIFGFMGGPLFAIIVLGMLLPFINSYGGLAALIASLILSCWTGLGSIISQIPAPILPMRTDGCPVEFTNFTTVSFTPYNGTTLQPQPAKEYLWLYKISHMYFGTVALIVAFIVGPVVSILTGRARGVNANLTFQWAEACCCYCPTPCKNCLRCGAKLHDEESSTVQDDEVSTEPEDTSRKNGKAYESMEGLENVSYVPCKDMGLFPDDRPRHRPQDNKTGHLGKILYGKNISPTTREVDVHSQDSNDDHSDGQTRF